MEKKIYFHDTDCGGVVYYSNYLKYLEEARTEFIEKKGIKVQDFLHAVRKCNITYKSPARYGDVLNVETKIKEITAAQIIFEQAIYHKSDKRLIVEAETSLVSLNKDFKPSPIPDEIKIKL
ncbi:MAG: YbgC/FadM family acyl-CoA thioesterase [Candidatus Omnitrophica bacterium]|nr:YbgC/FadM family acyl-CoA thioesterase [Candidatus Omnitrophota bacterium]